ncbi:TonB family protein [Burkholderia sp. BE17]|nr:TonB family protein [Burkholderia sp. BE17]
MSTAALGAREMGGAIGAVRDRARHRGMRVASVVAAVCVLHVGGFVLLAREQAVHSVPVQRQVMVATLIAPAPEASTKTTLVTKSTAASHAMRRATPVPRSSASRESSPAKPTAPVRTRPQVQDAPAPLRPVPDAAAIERQGAPQNVMRSNAAQTQTQTQTQTQASPAPTTPRFVAHPECALTRPDYPPQSLRMSEHGTVLVELETDAAGQVVAARVVTGSGYPRLDAAAREAVLASRCAPHVENGAPVPTRARAPITFNLDE